NGAKYKKRQMIVEHPFGTLKRVMNFEYFLLRGKKLVSGETGLAFFCYNMKRLINIKGTKEIVASI
ncbi:transposase, partial [Pseudobacteroides cellulosolvens]